MLEMALKQVNNKNKNASLFERRGSLIILIVTIIVILVLVIVGVVLGFTLEGTASKIALLSLIGLVVFVGILSFIFLEFQRRQAQRNMERGGQEWVREAYEEQRRLKTQASAPPPGDQTTWALAEPFRYSNRSTLPTK